MSTTDLQKISKISSQISTVSSPRDLVGTKPMKSLAHSYDGAIIEIHDFIKMALLKCTVALGINMSQAQIKMLVDDIYEVYSYESLEDIRECFKNARQGKYGFDMFKRDIISMPLVRFWMGLLLEEKAKARERIKREEKDQEKKPMEMASSENAQKYIDQMKAIVAKSKREKEENKKSVLPSNPDYWTERLKKDRGHRLVYRLICKKMNEGKELTKKELDWISSWNLTPNKMVG